MLEYNFYGNDNTQIFYDKYERENAKAVIQIVHGSIEHGKRYKNFASFLKDNGFTVYIADLRGHGRSINKKLNYLSNEDNGWDLYVEETKRLTEIIKEENPNKKIFLMGHSMGSFIVRDYLSKYSDLIDGAILSGTGSTSPIMMKIALWMIRREKRKHGKEAYSKKLHKLIYGGLDKKAIKLGVSSFVSRDEEVIKKYNNDPLCGETITIDYANEMAKGVLYIESKASYQNINDIPLLMFSGEKDPVGGKNCHLVYKIHKKYKKVITDLTLKIYEGALHEMINETNKEEVYEDISNWITSKL
ncbi:lysophospholipase [Mycoplasmatota bacterium]|nr:lysophospholipase [Mycoplasmatota bacterium]